MHRPVGIEKLLLKLIGSMAHGVAEFLPILEGIPDSNIA
jgi:hypothetical protein